MIRVTSTLGNLFFARSDDDEQQVKKMAMKPLLRRIDAFGKTIEDARVRTNSGGEFSGTNGANQANSEQEWSRFCRPC